MKRAILAMVCVVLTCGLALEAEAAEIVGVTRVGADAPVLVGQRVELDVRLSKSYAHPFDPAEVTVEAKVDGGGGGSLTLRAFWFQDFDTTIDDQGREILTPKGVPGFRLRFRPIDVMMLPVMTVTATDADGSASLAVDFASVEPGGSAAPPFVRLAQGPVPGFVRGGVPWVPFGANVCWSGAGGTNDIARWYDQMKAAGLEWSRLWMTRSDGTTLEWKDGDDGGDYAGVGTYNLKAAWRIDRILQLAEERGISLQLVIQQHSQFECSQWSSWADNPWNVANGGPCATSMEFFTNPDVVKGFDARMAYIVARYADSPAIMAWELWNEVDLIQGYDSQVVAAWSHGRVTNLRKADPYGHLVTTSFAMPAFDDQDWGSADWDYVQLHDYLQPYFDALPLFAPRLRAFGKPVVLGEFGIDTQGQVNLADKDGTHLVNATILAVLSGYTGGAMSWWWDNYLEPNLLWAPLGKVAAHLRDLGAASVVGPLDDATVQFVGTVEGGVVPDDHAVEVRAARTTDGALVWLHDAGSDVGRADTWAPVTHAGVVIDVAGVVPDGSACRGLLVECDPRGECQAVAESPTADDLAGGSIRIQASGFQRDLLVAVHCLGAVAGDDDGTGDAGAAGEDVGIGGDVDAATDRPGADDVPAIDSTGLDPAADPGEGPDVEPRHSHGCSASF